MSQRERASIESLLAHRGWVRDLALRLVRDESAADDLVQDTWVAALRNPPHTKGPIRAWLGTVLRNRAREGHRRTIRREAREATVARAGHEPAADEIVSRADAHRHVVTSVLTLDEPYRTTILLLFFEGLAPKDVAERLGVPVDTVRTRARRALATLRARLDRDHRGDRRAWAVALLGIDLWKQLGGATAGATTSAGSGLLGTGVMMGMWTTIGATAAGVAAGVLLTLLAQSPDVGESADEVAAAIPDAVSSEESGERSGGSRSGDTAAATNAGPGTSAVPATGPVDSALERPLPPAARRPISGRVLLADGSPVAGVTVRASVRRRSVWPPREAGPPARRTEAEMVEEARRAARWDAATTRETITDADGGYELTGLRSTTYHMDAWATGMDVRPGPGRRTWEARPGDTFDFEAWMKLPVQVSVLDASGAAPAKAYVRWKSVGKGGRNAGAHWSPALPTVYMEPGKWEVTANLQGEDEVRSQPVTVEVVAGTATPSVVLRVRGVPLIQGRLAIPGTQQWSRMTVHAVRHEGDAEPSDEALSSSRKQPAVAPDYAFSFTRIEPGTYTVAASFDGRTMLARTTVVVGEGRSECTLEIPHLGSERAIHVRVLGPDGRPVEDAEFGQEIRAADSFSSGGLRAHRQADGSWLYPIARGQTGGEDRPGAKWALVVKSESLGEVRVPFVPGRDASLDVQFDEPATVEVTVAVYSHAVHGGRLGVTLVREGEDQPSGGAGIRRRDGHPALDRDGKVTFSLVPPGNYDLHLWAGEAGVYSLRVASERITVGAGLTRVSPRAPRLVDVHVRVPDLEPGDKIELASARSPGNYFFTSVERLDASRTATWTSLAVGNYALAVVIAGERREMLLRVTGPGTHTFAPGALAGLSITIDRSNGKLARAGFQTGDVLTRIAGVGFTTRWKWKGLISGAKEKESVAFTVLRGGRETVVNADPSLLTGFFEVGGHWEFVER